MSSDQIDDVTLTLAELSEVVTDAITALQTNERASAASASDTSRTYAERVYRLLRAEREGACVASLRAVMTMLSDRARAKLAECARPPAPAETIALTLRDGLPWQRVPAGELKAGDDVRGHSSAASYTIERVEPDFPGRVVLHLQPRGALVLPAEWRLAADVLVECRRVPRLATPPAQEPVNGVSPAPRTLLERLMDHTVPVRRGADVIEFVERSTGRPLAELNTLTGVLVPYLMGPHEQVCGETLRRLIQQTMSREQWLGTGH